MIISLDDIRKYINKNSIEINSIYESIFENKPIKTLGILKIEKEGLPRHNEYKIPVFPLMLITMKGPKNSIYEKGIFQISIEFPNHFPYEKPEIKIKNPIVHLQVLPEDGHICVLFINNWNKTTLIPEILVGLYLFLQKEDQNIHYPYRKYAELYYKDRNNFNKLAREYCIKYSSTLDSEESEKEDINIKRTIELSPGEEMISLIFNSMDNNGLYSIICKNTDNFIKVENLLYKKCPEYKDKEIYFLVNGQPIEKDKTLKENKIKDNDIILFNSDESSFT